MWVGKVSIARLVYWWVFSSSVLCSGRLRATGGLFLFRDATMHNAVEIEHGNYFVLMS